MTRGQIKRERKKERRIEIVKEIGSVALGSVVIFALVWVLSAIGCVGGLA